MTEVPITEEDSKSLDRLAIGRSLQIEDIEDMERHQGRLDKIIEWAEMKGAKNRDDYIAELAHLRTKIGNPSIFDLSVYVSLEMEHMATEKALDALKRKKEKSEERLKKFDHTQEKG